MVIDAGAYEGNFAKTIAEKYDCRVIGFEPITEFHTKARATCAHLAKVTIFNLGLSGETRDEEFAIANDSTGQFKDKDFRKVERVTLINIAAMVHCLPDIPLIVDLLKLNIEGGEYEVMERILEDKIAHRFRNFQIQFHTCAPDYEARHAAICAGLALTHEPTFSEPWCWEGWTLK